MPLAFYRGRAYLTNVTSQILSAATAKSKGSPLTGIYWISTHSHLNPWHIANPERSDSEVEGQSPDGDFFLSEAPHDTE